MSVEGHYWQVSALQYSSLHKKPHSRRGHYLEIIFSKPTGNTRAIVNMARSFNDGLSFWIHKGVIEDIFRTLKHHCCFTRIVLGDIALESLNSHIGKHCLLLRRIHIYVKFHNRIAELEVQYGFLDHLIKSI